MPEETTKGNIMIVDDEPTVADIIAQTLEGRNYKTKTYTSGQEAIDNLKEILEKGEEPNISVILSDIKMPDRDGLKTVEDMLRLYKEKNKPEIVFMSGQFDDEQKNGARKLSPYEILIKPISLKLLAETINLANNNFYKRTEH